MGKSSKVRKDLRRKREAERLMEVLTMSPNDLKSWVKRKMFEDEIYGEANFSPLPPQEVQPPSEAQINDFSASLLRAKARGMSTEDAVRFAFAQECQVVFLGDFLDCGK